jgi:hypothetical protein
VWSRAGGVSIGCGELGVQLRNSEATDPQKPLCYTVGVLYVGSEQTNESQWFANQVAMRMCVLACVRVIARRSEDRQSLTRFCTGSDRACRSRHVLDHP